MKIADSAGRPLTQAVFADRTLVLSSGLDGLRSTLVWRGDIKTR